MQRYQLTAWGIEDALVSEIKRMMRELTPAQLHDIEMAYFATMVGRA